MTKNFLPNILVTGANGQLGSMLKQRAPSHENSMIYCDRAELDITDRKTVMAIFAKYRPELVINTAAYTAVDKAEDDINQAILINAKGAENIAYACKALEIPLIHISTDYVFSGKQNRAMREDDQTHPVNAYGHSKLLGEQAVQSYCDKHIILRISGVYSEFGTNFYKTMHRLARDRKELRIVNDQITCPTYAGDIADAIYTIARKPFHYGIYHFCSQPEVSWHSFATKIIEEAKRHNALAVESIIPITTAEFAARATRPAFSVLDCSKIFNDYGISQPDWKSKLCL